MEHASHSIISLFVDWINDCHEFWCHVPMHNKNNLCDTKPKQRGRERVSNDVVPKNNYG